MLELRDPPYEEELARLRAAVEVLRRAIGERDDISLHARYAEAKLNARRLLKIDYDPILDRFPKFGELVQKSCSASTAEYMVDDVRLDLDKFLDFLEMLAHDHSDPATIPNPPAWIRIALARKQNRQDSLNRVRWMPPTPGQSNALEDPKHLESSIIAEVDWEHGSRDVKLPSDQTRAVEAKFDGLDLQSSDAPEYLGWKPSRLNAVRRSLEPGRRWGKQLRRRFASYRPQLPGDK
jgi:hypothetical protein